MKSPKVTPQTSAAPPAKAVRVITPSWAITFALAGIALLFLTLAMQRIWASDLWWQLRTGQYILEHGFPTTDAYSYTVPNNAWVELRWIFSVVILKLFELGGPALLIIFETAMLAAAFGIYAWRHRSTLAIPVGTLALAVGVMTAYQRFVVRPELVTYLFVAIFITVLEARRQGGARRLIWLLPVLQIVWVNAHTLFVFGPVVAGAFAGADTLSRWWGILTTPDGGERRPRRTRAAQPIGARPKPFDIPLCASALLVTAACFVNPWGTNGVTFPLILLEETRPGHVLARSIEEFTSPFFDGRWSPAYTFGCVLAALGALTFILNWRRTDLARLFLWASHVYFAATSARNLGIFAFIGVWAVLANLTDLAKSPRTPAIMMHPTRAFRIAGQTLIGLCSLGLAWGVFTDRFASQHQEPRCFSFGTMRSITPAAATEFLLASGAKPQVFHSMRDASYLTWAAHEKYKVFVDGRLEVYTAPFVADFLGFLSKDWDKFTADHNINIVIGNRDEFPLLTSRLARRAEWVLVYLDDIQSVWVRDIPEHADLIAQHRIDPKQAWIPTGPEPSEQLSALRNALGGLNYPWYSMGMARQFLALESPVNAHAYLERAHQNAPWYPDARLMLAQFEILNGNPDRAASLMAGAKFTEEQLAGGDRMLADLLIHADREVEAIEPLKRSLKYFAKQPGASSVYAKLGNAYFSARQWSDAATNFRAAAQLAPRVAEYHENLALSLAEQKDFLGAKTALEQALKLDPRRPDLLVILGRWLMELGDSAEARKCFEYALRVQPGYPPAQNALQRLAAPPAP